MKYYLDITLLPSQEIGLYFLWGKTYSLLHLRLVEMKNETDNSAIGFSFPEYKPRFLGQKLRLFAEDKTQLENFNADECLKNFKDYIHIKTIQTVPEKIIGYASFYRIQIKSNTERLIRRSVKNDKCTQKEAQIKLKTLTDKETTLPYIQMKSQSNGQPFKLFIAHTKQTQQQPDGFNCYGLSKKSSVPIF